jgi:hypothetical protein
MGLGVPFADDVRDRRQRESDTGTSRSARARRKLGEDRLDDGPVIGKSREVIRQGWTLAVSHSKLQLQGEQFAQNHALSVASRIAEQLFDRQSGACAPSGLEAFAGDHNELQE